MAKRPLPKKKDLIEVYVSFRGNHVLVDEGVDINVYDGILTVEDDESRDIAYFKEWDFARIVYVPEKPIEDKE